MAVPEFLISGRISRAYIQQSLIHVPFYKSNVPVFSQQLCHEVQDELVNLRLRDVEGILVPGSPWLPVFETIDPVRMTPVQVTVRVHRLRLHPDAKVHPKTLHAGNQFPKTLGKLFLIDIPVPQTGSVAMPLPEPSVIDHEQLHAHAGGPPCEFLLAFHPDIEARGLPGIVQHPSGLYSRQDLFILKSVQISAHGTVPACGEAHCQYRRPDALTLIQRTGKIKIADSASHLHVLEWRFLKRNLPVPAIAQQSEPDISRRFRCGAVIQRKSRVKMRTCVAGTGLYGKGSVCQVLIINMEFCRPPAA